MKYHAERVKVEGEVFDSKREFNRWCELKLLERAGAISDLKRQVKFVLIPTQKIDGKVVEREVSYKADFVYTENGKTVVEDSKGYRTKEYILKRKLLLYTHGIQLKET